MFHDDFIPDQLVSSKVDFFSYELLLICAQYIIFFLHFHSYLKLKEIEGTHSQNMI